MHRGRRWLDFSLTVLLTTATIPVSACILENFQVSTEPQLPAASEPFELIIDYQGSFSCVRSEDLLITAENLRFEIDCNCPFTVTLAVPQQFRTTVPGLPAGLQTLEAVNLGSAPAPRTVATIQFLIGHAPAIPFSPLAWTLFSLALAGAAVWVLQR